MPEAILWLVRGGTVGCAIGHGGRQPLLVAKKNAHLRRCVGDERYRSSKHLSALELVGSATSEFPSLSVAGPETVATYEEVARALAGHRVM